MKVWHTFGAVGDTIVELTKTEMISLRAGKEITIDGTAVILCVGKSNRKPLGAAPSRKEQLGIKRS